MKKIAKEVGTKEGALGTLEFPVFDSVEEVVDVYGDRQALVLLQRAINIDVERIGREALKVNKTVEEAQAIVNEYKPGVRGAGKPTTKVLLNLFTKFCNAAETGHPDAFSWMSEGQKIYGAESVEAAVTFLRSKEGEL